MNAVVVDTLRNIDGDTPHFFSNGNGRVRGDVKKAFHRALRKSGIEDFRFHDLRHTFASNLVMAGESIKTVQELLGHKDIKMTMRYAHLAPDYKKKAIKVLERIFTEKPEAKVLPLRTGEAQEG